MNPDTIQPLPPDESQVFLHLLVAGPFFVGGLWRHGAGSGACFAGGAGLGRPVGSSRRDRALDGLPDTAILLAGVGLLAGVVGTSAAWLVTAYDFPGRRVLEWALLLPLAMPTYIVAYAYLDILHPIGPVQGAIRWLLGYSSPREFRLPDIRSTVGCIVLLGFVLFPYVYIPVRAMFLTQAGNLLEVARTLGVSRRAAFSRSRCRWRARQSPLVSVSR